MENACVARIMSRTKSHDEYRRKAATAEAFAHKINDPEIRTELRNLAETYREIAEQPVDRPVLDSGALEPEGETIEEDR